MTAAQSALRGFQSCGVVVSRFTERWVPEGWTICMALTAAVLLFAIVGVGVSPHDALMAWGGGVWMLVALAMQFTLTIVAAYACMTAPPVYRLLDRVAAVPNPDVPWQAVLWVGALSVLAAYLNWALCLIGGALFIPFVYRRNPKTDVRLLVVATLLGQGTVWHGGLSGSAPLMMATPGNPLMLAVNGVPIVSRLYPITETLLNSFNLVYLFTVGVVAVLMTVLLHPAHGAKTLGAEEVRAMMPQMMVVPPSDGTPAAAIGRFTGWTWLAALLLAYPVGYGFIHAGFGATWTINAYNATFLVLALLLHRNPLSFLGACRQGLDKAWGIVIQFPFYAGIFGLITLTPMSKWLGEWFAKIAARQTFSLVVYLYSALIDLFVPSGGAKWMIEAPYLLSAGKQVGISFVEVLLPYSYGSSTPNLIHPYFAIPILAVTGLRFGEIVGYGFIVTVATLFCTCAAMLLMPMWF
jgi:short-chain fatty acids transporter